jgi:uncharacterized protein YcaQ
VPLAAARRLLLAGQGLLGEPVRATADGVYSLVERLGFVQIDSINVVARAHDLILASRVAGYRPSLLTGLLERRRQLFEHWTHDAAAIPTAWFPHWRYRFERAGQGVMKNRWWRERLGPQPEARIAEVRERIEREGPLLARDFSSRAAEAGRPEPGGGSWWGWRPQKAALEYLWFTGEVTVAGRRNFHKVYDLTSRVLPAAWAAPRPDPGANLDWACRSALERLGTATPPEIAAFWRAVPGKAVQGWCQAAARRGEIAAVEVETPDSRPRPAYAVLDWERRAAEIPPARPRMRLLCPFDPILHDRQRTLRLFGFDYRFEAFVPAAARRHGYYVLPILEGERLVGRLDPKLHRDRGWLEVRRVTWEPGIRAGRARQAALEAAVGRLARFLGAERWSLPATAG